MNAVDPSGENAAILIPVAAGLAFAAANVADQHGRAQCGLDGLHGIDKLEAVQAGIGGALLFTPLGVGVRALQVARAAWAARGVGKIGQGILPRNGPIPKSLGAASRAERIAKKLGLNPKSEKTRQVLNSLDDTVSDFIAKFREPRIRKRIPGEFLDKTVEEALLSKNSTVRKLLIGGDFDKK